MKTANITLCEIVFYPLKSYSWGKGRTIEKKATKIVERKVLLYIVLNSIFYSFVIRRMRTIISNMN